ncbi:hypothetical protein PBRA_009051, partial [Plasmodiophora brassicae]
ISGHLGSAGAVDAIDIRDDLCDCHRRLNDLVGIDSATIRVVQGDILGTALRGEYDIMVAQLVFLHIADKAQLFRQVHQGLRPGGRIYIEDYVACDGAADNDDDQGMLRDSVGVPARSLLTRGQYEDALAAQAMRIVQWDDCTSAWSAFVWERAERFLADADGLQGTHPAMFQAMAHFYTTTAKLLRHDIDADLYPKTRARIGPGWVPAPVSIRGVAIVAVAL